jgi:UDP-N-acetylmuramoylalanine--D-glutamate ligase
MKRPTRGRTPEAGKRLGIGDGRVLIYGMGRSGLAAAHLLVRHGVGIGFYDDGAVPGYRSLSDRIPWPQVPVHLQRLDPEVSLGYELVVVSPGVPAHSPTLLALKAAGLRVISEVELAFAFAAAPVVAVTGTNGKTTTATMANLLLSAAGLKSCATGNIGYPFSQAVVERRPDVFVVEVSSFQLYHADRFAPRVAIITGFAPNHLDWHGDEESYFAAKLSVARNLRARDAVVFPAGNGRIRRALARSPARKLTFGRGGDVSFSAADRSVVCRTARGAGGSGRRRVLARLGPILDRLTWDFRIAAESFQAACALAVALRVRAGAIEKMLAGFTPLPHRIEVVARRAGVTYINDSKSTSIDATIFALTKQSVPVVLMLGGRDKGLSFTDLVPAARGRVKAVVAFGEAREKIARELGGDLPLHQAGSLAEAVDRARHLAGPGETVLFSPACASYDQFTNYEERGDTFRQLVQSL